MHTDWEFAYLPGGVMSDGDAEAVPPKVTGIAVAPGADQNLAALSWNAAPEEAGVAGYEVLLANGRTVKAKTNSIELKKLDAGYQTVTVFALDKAKNRSVGAEFAFDVADITAPKTGKVTAVQTSADTVQLSFAGFFDNVGIKNYRVYLGGEFLGTTGAESFTYQKADLAGKLAFTVTAVDAAGNESKPGKATVTIQDVVAPNKVTGIAIAPGADQNAALLNWDVPFDNVGVTGYEILLANGRTVKAKTNSVVLKKLDAGYQTVTVFALDKAKNRSVGAEFAFDVADITAPKTGKVTAVQTSADTVQLSFAGFFDNVGIKNYRVYLGGEFLGTTGAESFTYQKDDLAGKLAFTVTAVDAAGNESKPGKATVTIQDVVAPEQVKGVTAEVSGRTAVIRWSEAADNVGVTAYDVVIDGRHYSAKTNSYVFKNMVEGTTYQVTVAAVDKAKNVGAASAVCSFGMEAPPPDETAPGKVTGVKAVLSGANATISWNAATDNVGVTGYEITVNGTKYTSTGTSLTLKELAVGTYNVTVLAKDAAGNAGKPSDVCSFRYSSGGGSSAASHSVRLHTDGVVVESAASMTGKTVASNQILVAEKGGTVTNTVVNGGTLLVSSGGTATATEVNSGQASAAARGALSGVTMKRGYLTVLDGGTAADVVLSGGALIVHTNGSSWNNKVLSGSVDVSSGGVVQSTTLGSGVYLRAGKQGSALATVLGSGAHAVVSEGGLMSGGTVSSGAGMTVSQGGAVRDMRVLAGGSAYVSNGATVSNLQMVGNYVKLQLGIDSATNVHFISGGSAHTVANGSLSDITAHLYTYLEVSEGGLVKNVRLGAAGTSKGGAVELFTGGKAVNVANHNYGQVNVFTGGFLSGGSTDTEGEIYLYGGKAENLQADSGGYIWIHSGSVASGITLTSEGKLTVSSGGSASGMTVMSKCRAIVEESNAHVTGVEIQSSGIVEVCGGNVSDVTVRKGGLLTFSSGFFIMDGPWKQSLNGQASNVVLNGGTLGARYTGSATQVKAQSGAEIQVSSGSLVRELTLSSGAYTVVNDCGVLRDADILAGAQLDLRPGASASLLRISAGAGVNLSFSGGMKLDGSAGGRAFTATGGVLSGYTQALGVLALKEGTTASALEVTSGGRVNLETGAAANLLTVSAGALAYLYGSAQDLRAAGETHLYGGRFTSALVTAGYTQLHAGAVASEVKVSTSGRLLVSGGALVSALAVSAGGQAVLYQGAQVSSAVVKESGTMHISSGATVSGLTISSGGRCYVSGSAESVRTYADLNIFSGGVLSAATVESGYLHISGGGVGERVQIESSARLIVYSGGTASNLGINAGGRVVASSGAVVDGLQTAGSEYVLTLKSGSVLTGDIALDQGRVMAEEGSVVKWDLTQSAPNVVALIRGLEFINGGAFTIDVSSTQAAGTYVLGSYTGSGKTFDRDVTVTVNGASIGTMNPRTGGRLSSGGLNLELFQSGDTVQLGVSYSASSPCSDSSALWRQDHAVDLGAFAAPETDLLALRRDESALGTMLAAFGS